MSLCAIFSECKCATAEQISDIICAASRSVKADCALCCIRVKSSPPETQFTFIHQKNSTISNWSRICP